MYDPPTSSGSHGKYSVVILKSVVSPESVAVNAVALKLPRGLHACSDIENKDLSSTSSTYRADFTEIQNRKLYSQLDGRRYIIDVRTSLCTLALHSYCGPPLPCCRSVKAVRIVMNF